MSLWLFRCLVFRVDASTGTNSRLRTISIAIATGSSRKISFSWHRKRTLKVGTFDTINTMEFGDLRRVDGQYVEDGK